MANYLDINANSTSQIISAAGANAQAQAWSMTVVEGAQQRSMFGRVFHDGVNSKKPIRPKLDLNKVHGQVMNIKSKAPLGASPGVQGSGNNRVAQGEQEKFIMWQAQLGVQWQGKRWNNIAADQTMLGIGKPLDSEARTEITDLFSLVQSRTIEANFVQRATARNSIYPNGKTSIGSLRSADTFSFDSMQQISDRMANNMAKPIALYKPKAAGCDEPIRGYYVIAPNPLVRDMEKSSDFQTLMSNAQVRGDSNTLFYGGFPMIGGSMLERYQIQSDDSDGPKGTLGAPHAYLGAALAKAIANDGTANIMKGGGSAASAALTDPTPPLFFQLFPNAAFQTFEVTKIAAVTTTQYCLAQNSTTGLWRMYSYTTNDGNKLTLTGALLKSTSTTSGGIDSTTVGNVTAAASGTGVWTDAYIGETNLIGDIVIPCNANGQAYVSGYALGDECMWSIYGLFTNGSAMGRRTMIDGNVINHGRESEVGMDMNWGCECVPNANNFYNGYSIIYGSFNPAGTPFLT